jgi:hypothetical protein
MPRLAGITVPASPHHVTRRGNRKPKRFWDEPSSLSDPAESRRRSSRVGNYFFKLFSYSRQFG